jgi:hypothetical protein
VTTKARRNRFIQPAKGIRIVTLREVRDRLTSIVEQALMAKQMALTNDNLCDVLDAMDNELQAVIRLVAEARG